MALQSRSGKRRAPRNDNNMKRRCQEGPMFHTFGGHAILSQFQVQSPFTSYSTPPPSCVSVVRDAQIPLNSRICLDGKYFEVFYINGFSVIQKDSFLFKVRFSGPPQEILVDGAVYQLGFREEKWIRLGAQEHVFRFGGPSRELLIDNRHFKATFGGSPIVVNINGCRHQIQLLGPPPRVVVEDRPSYDLMPKTEEKKIEVVKSERKPPSSGLSAAPALAGDVLSLLARLKEKGLLGNTKPVPEEAPSEGLLANPLFMATKNTTALQDILAPKDACGDCGLNLEGLDYQARGQHKDDHVAENLRKLGGKRDTRPWFSGRTTLWESTRSKLAGTKISKPSVENGLDAESTDSQKVCPHCREAFEEYYNQDEDLWMYRNSVVHRGTIYHRECARDLSLTL